ncbi:uncharacterized protein Dana_GF19576 [Drosophila ananassae]|uniref:Uncharacterized protein n=1 Tax=Drosophila ananassae TaxID=7217 RepID=B3N2J2_DROAN|nr:uncharacterized protein LOC6502331 [Drosophila ananassae]EDV44957.2 uncharacterized protein Dana_GF19576 [Drosophila ananassae]
MNEENENYAENVHQNMCKDDEIKKLKRELSYMIKKLNYKEELINSLKESIATYKESGSIVSKSHDLHIKLLQDNSNQLKMALTELHSQMNTQKKRNGELVSENAMLKATLASLQANSNQ